MNRKSKKAVKRGETKRVKASKTLEPITTKERSAVNPVDLINELMMMRWKQEGEILKQETMPVEQTRVIIRAMYDRMNKIASHICEMMLNDIIKAEIVQHGPQWDKSIAISKMAWHLQLDDKHIETEIDEWLKCGQGAFRKEYGPMWKLNLIVYRHYKYLRLETGWLFEPPKREQKALRLKTWRKASQEPYVKEHLRGKSSQEVEDIKGEALEMARYSFHRDPEIKFLFRTFRR